MVKDLFNPRPRFSRPGHLLLLLLLLLFVVVHTKKGAIKQKLKGESERERLHTTKISD